MKLSKEQEKRLKKMCLERKSNKEIASELGIELKDVHASRSRLGLTIPKVKTILAKNGDKKIEKRTKEEINEEINKVIKAKAIASKKIKRCNERLEELHNELGIV